MQTNAAGTDRTFGRRMLIYVAFLFAIVMIGIFAYRTGYSRGYASGDSDGYARAMKVQPPGTCIMADTTIYKTSITYDDCVKQCGTGCTWTTASRDTANTLKVQQ